MESITEEKLINAKLKPPKNARHTTPRVCGACVHIKVIVDDYGYAIGNWSCERGEVEFDAGNGMQWFTTCDYFKPQS